MTFKDHFSGHAADYQAARPHYPPELFAWLAEVAPRRECVWDCGCGNGQASVALAEHFDAVVATDPSGPQIASAVSHPRVAYQVAPAEASGLAVASVDVVTVAQALHWFDFERFYAEVRRVLRPVGLVAVWSYGLHHVDQGVDPVLHRFFEMVEPYWPPERDYVEKAYRTIPFPFAELQPPAFAMHQAWDLTQLEAYLDTWSALKYFTKDRGTSPLALVHDDLLAAWGDPATVRAVHWPLHMRAGLYEG
jgi:SAM-dependent methyltransferase